MTPNELRGYVKVVDDIVSESDSIESDGLIAPVDRFSSKSELEYYEDEFLAYCRDIIGKVESNKKQEIIKDIIEKMSDE